MLSEPRTQMRGRSELLAAMLGRYSSSAGGTGSRWRVLSIRKVIPWLALVM